MSWETQLDDYFAALDWVVRLLARTRANQLDLPTPCDEYSVRSLAGHLIGTARRAWATVDSTAPSGTPHVVVDVADGELLDAYRDAAQEARRSWLQVDDAGDVVRAPWGACSAMDAARGFTVETIVHGWDLAVATGQDPESLAVVAQRCLSYVAVPDRLVGVMYAPPVKPQGMDRPTTLLARRLGRYTEPN